MNKDRLIDTTKIFTFDSAHKLNNYDGDCKYLHGHTYKLEITIRGKRDHRGMVIDFKDLKAIVKEKIVSKLDHRYLNDIFEFNTTCENIVEWIFETLNLEISEADNYLQKVVLWETPTSYASLDRGEFDA